MTPLKYGAIFTAALSLTLHSLCASLMIVGNDEKITWSDDGKRIYNPDNDQDTVHFIDIVTNPEEPKIVAKLTLENSIFGPPTNLIITPDQKLALVANSMKWYEEGGSWKGKPNNELHIIDLEGSPKYLETIKVGQQPSGLDISPDGKLLLIANRAEDTVSIVKVSGKKCELIGAVNVGAPVADVAFTPDGKRALIVKKQHNAVGIIKVDGGLFSYSANDDINVGISPYTVEVSPLGNIALVNNSGVTGGNDGNVDTVSVIDLTVDRPHVIDVVAVGDGPEGLAFSPDGKIALSVLINGTQNAAASSANAWAANKNGTVAVLAIDGKKVTKIDEIEVDGGMPEGVVFTPDSRHAYIGNFLSQNISILKVGPNGVSHTGKILELGASPASMR